MISTLVFLVFALSISFFSAASILLCYLQHEEKGKLKVSEEDRILVSS